jgi:S1-C subfamily serine protease
LNPLQGITIGNLSPSLSDQIGMSFWSQGVVVLKVGPTSAAQRFGFQIGDVIKEINDVEVKTVTQLQDLLSKKFKEWLILIKRGDDVLSMTVTR